VSTKQGLYPTGRNLTEETEITGERINLHNDEFQNLSSPYDFIPVTKQRRMSWEEQVAGMGEMRNAKF
jgi:hypothetical protein